MRFLIIGGTRFLGRALTKTLVKTGHEVTLFNRGISDPDLFSNVERVCGDREMDLDLLSGREFDYVIDTCAYLPHQIEISASFFKKKVKRYLFISSISVYSDFNKPNIDENYKKAPYCGPDCPKLTIKDLSNENYGALKYLCEEKLIEYFPENHIIVRPGMIIGPYDRTQRFSKLLEPFVKKQTFTVPQPADLPIQFIDVYDLSDFIIRLCFEENTGTFNATGPKSRMTFNEMFETVKKVSGSEIRVIWTDPKELEKDKRLTSFYESQPFFVTPEDRGVYECSIDHALVNGLLLSSTENILKRALTWYFSA